MNNDICTEPQRTMELSVGAHASLRAFAKDPLLYSKLCNEMEEGYSDVFLAFLIVPGWWKVAALLAAAVLPAFAVLLANNSDHRPPAMAHDEAEERPALPSSVVVRGSVEEDTDT